MISDDARSSRLSARPSADGQLSRRADPVPRMRSTATSISPGRAGGEFTAEDEELVLALAATAGIAIENARLYEESPTSEQWLQASAEISGVLLSPAGDRDPLQLIVDTIKRLADADVATLVVPVDDPGLLRVAVAAGDGEAELRGMEYPLDDTLVALAMDTGRGVRVGVLEQQQGYTVHLSQVVDVGAGDGGPAVGDAGPHGAIMSGASDRAAQLHHRRPWTWPRRSPTMPPSPGSWSRPAPTSSAWPCSRIGTGLPGTFMITSSSGCSPPD